LDSLIKAGICYIPLCKVNDKYIFELRVLIKTNLLNLIDSHLKTLVRYVVNVRLEVLYREIPRSEAMMHDTVILQVQFFEDADRLFKQTDTPEFKKLYVALKTKQFLKTDKNDLQ